MGNMTGYGCRKHQVCWVVTSEEENNKKRGGEEIPRLYTNNYMNVRRNPKPQ